MKDLDKLCLVMTTLLLLVVYIPRGLGQEQPVTTQETDILKAEQQGLTLWQTIKAGGWVMGSLFIISIAAVALTIDLFINIREKIFISPSFVSNIKSDLEAGELGAAISRCEETPGPLSSILKAGFTRFGKGFQQVKEAVQIAGEMESESIMQRISYLSVIGTISPMLGLLGTVLGMVQAFSTIALESALGKPQLLALSISKALITTAAGLTIGLPAMGFYFYLRGKGTRIIMKLELTANSLVGELESREAGP